MDSVMHKDNSALQEWIINEEIMEMDRFSIHLIIRLHCPPTDDISDRQIY